MKSVQTHTHHTVSAAGTLKKHTGFTLIEVLLAVSILAIGLLAIASLQISAIRVNSSASHLSVRTTWAQDKLEQLIALPYGNANLSLGDHAPEEKSDGTFVAWNVVSGTVTDTKKITLTVTKAGKTTRFSFIKADMED